MHSKKIVSYVTWLTALAPILLIGCAATYKADPKLASQYTPPPAPGADETDVYVIRGSNMLGAARGLWIAQNDKVVADLSNGSHVLLHMKSGINTVNAVQWLSGHGFSTVDNRPGETVFLSFSYAHGTMTEVPKDIGISMVVETKNVLPLAEPRPNTGYDDGLLNPGMFGLDIVTDGGNKLEPDASSAVITFFRAGKLADVPLSIWSESDFVGTIKGGTYFQVRVTPGQHAFIAKSDRYAVLKTDVVAGKNYFAQFEVNFGWDEGHIKILPLDAAVDAAKIDGWFKTLSLQSINTAALQSERIKPRITAGNNYLDVVRKKIAAGRQPSRELTASQGR